MNVETIHEEWGTVYLKSHKAKAHLFEGCRYVKRHDLEPQDIGKYPPGHLEFCADCVEYFRRWRENTDASENQCVRCGKKETQPEYCATCYSRIEHTKAKNRL